MLTKKEAINQRHSVRQYEDRPIERELITILSEEIKKINEESGLHIQLVTNEPKAFDSTLAHYGKFSGVHITHEHHTHGEELQSDHHSNEDDEGGKTERIGG